MVRIGNFLAVTAEREEAAIRAAAELAVEWEESPLPPPMARLAEFVRMQLTSDRVEVDEGDLEVGFSSAADRRAAEYLQPFQAHASLAPSCAVAAERDGVMTVWCSSQGGYPLRGALAELLEVEADRVHVIHLEGAGCYGHNGADDVAADAVLLARASGRAVRVQWSRKDEFIGEPYGPAMVTRLAGAVDPAGRICAWDHEVWTPTHGARPRTAIDLLATQLIRCELPPAPSRFGGGNRNAPTNYEVENQRLTLHWTGHLPLRTSSLRTLGAFANTFANESFLDELADAAGVDPLAFRLRHLSDPRAKAVLTEAGA